MRTRDDPFNDEIIRVTLAEGLAKRVCACMLDVSLIIVDFLLNLMRLVCGLLRG